MAVQTQIQARRGTAATWTSTNPTLAAGETGFETDTGKFKIGNGSTAWAALAYSAGATAVTYLFNATAGQTTFSGADANALTLAYTVGAEQVYLNGVLQVRGSDYTASNGTSIVLTSGALVSDVLNVIAYSAMTITDTYTQAQADAKFVPQAANFFAGKNKIINGDFGVWQRGTNITLSNNTVVYTADRFYGYSSHTAGTASVSQQTFTLGSAPVAGYEASYFARLTCGSTTTYAELSQRIEDVRTFAGQTVTLSYWAKASVTTAAVMGVYQFFGSTGSSPVPYSSNISITTSWQRFTATFNIASIAGKTLAGPPNYIYAQLYTNSPTASQTIDVWGVQLEAGSVATPFQTATGTIGGELQACKRYYWNFSSLNSSVTNFTIGSIDSTTAAKFVIPMPVTMRSNPSFSVTGTANFAVKSAGTNKIPSAINLDQANVDSVSINAVSTGYVAGDAATLFANGSTGCSLQFSAEL